MIKKTHTRNQRRMYRIHKQEEQIEKDKIIIAEQQIELDKYKKEIEYEQHCNEQLRNKITNLEYKIKRLEENIKYKEVLDEIQNMIKPTLITTQYHSEIKQGVDKLSFDVIMQPVEDKITYIQPDTVIYEMPEE